VECAAVLQHLISSQPYSPWSSQGSPWGLSGGQPCSHSVLAIAWWRWYSRRVLGI